MIAILRSPYAWMGLGIAIIVIIQITAAKPVSWDYTYEADDKNPHGGWIAAQYLERTFDEKMKIVRNALWVTSKLDQPDGNDTYVVITNAFKPDDEAKRLILETVGRGGTLFVASYSMDEDLASELDIEATHKSCDSLHFRVGDTTTSFKLGAFVHANTFTAKTPGIWAPLAHCDTSVVIMTRQWGSGTIILCGMPDMLTNVAMLDTAQRAVPIAILSTLPNKAIAWDEHYKPKHSSDMSVNQAIGTIPGLSLAYWILIVTGLVYIVMAGRRRQRPIPIVPPVRNTSVEFVSTVGRLYYGRHDNLNLANKLSRLFRDHVVTRLRLRLDVNVQVLAQNIGEATGVELNLVNDILRRISHADSGLEFSDEEIVAFHNDLQLFQQQSTI